MWLVQVFTDNGATAFLDFLLLANNFNTSSTRTGSRFHNIHILEIAHLPVNHPPFIILRENICPRCNIKCFAMQSSHSQNVSPHQVFTPNTPGSSKMVSFLKLVHIFNAIYFKQSGPKHIPI